MFQRLSTEQRWIGGSAVVALLSSYLTWYTYDTGSFQFSISGFRASIFGFIFVVAVGVVITMLLAEMRVLHLPRTVDARGITTIASRVAVGAIVIQFLLSLDQSQALHKGLGVAFLAAIVMLLASRRRAHKFADAI
jgi:hypothetical protein